MRTNIAIIRDHSGSMVHLASRAKEDYNSLVQTLKNASAGIGDSFLTVVECNNQEPTIRERSVPLYNVASLSYYVAGGSTPLYDSVDAAIKELSKYDGPDVANLLLVITDGEENYSRINPNKLKQNIIDLQNTDRWTFTFRVPRGYGKKLINGLGLHSGNIIEWDQNEADLDRSTRDTVTGTQSYFAARSLGKTSVHTFYANPADVTGLEHKLDDVSGKYKRYNIDPYQDGISIKDFCIEKIGKYEVGRVHYSLNKTEKVQQNKDIVIRDTGNGAIYAGKNARTLLGLPTVGEIKLAPGNLGKYEVFVRSTSNNRKLFANNGVLVKS